MLVSMEYELRKHFTRRQALNLEHITTAIVENEALLLSLVSANWEDSSASGLLQIVVNQWVEIRSFSYASAWVDQYKVAQKQKTQKSKGVHKQLVSKSKKSKSVSTVDSPDSE